MKEEILSKISKYYTKKIKEFGIDSRGVDWKNKESQNLRFKQLLKIINNKSLISLNDLGCGYGALFSYLQRYTNVELSKYYGYDISEEMLNVAKNLIKNKDLSFIRSDKILFKADYSISSGIFNVKLDIKTKTWKKFILSTLMNMNEKSSQGFAFNCLTSYVDYEEDHLYYGDPLFYFDYCKQNFSKNITLIHDYNLHEWTILVRKKF